MKKILLLLILMFCEMSICADNWELVQKVVPSVQREMSEFGSSVAISGDYAVIGASLDNFDESDKDSMLFAGAAYIFHKEGNKWIQQQKIVASDRTEAASFGASVAISGDYITVGSDGEGYFTDGINCAGAAYIFVRNGSAWIQQQKIIAPVRAEWDGFGQKVAISGDYIIISASGEDEDENETKAKTKTKTNTIDNSGAVYVYKLNGTLWSLQQKVVAPVRVKNDCFGNAVSISGNHFIVASTFRLAALDYGSIYIYENNGNEWTLQQKLTKTDFIQSYRGYPENVSIFGDYIAVGSWVYDYLLEVADIFVRDGTIWKAQQHITLSASPTAYTCTDVAINGKNLIISTVEDGVFIYERNDSIWTEKEKIVNDESKSIDVFSDGNSVTISDHYAVIGAQYNGKKHNGSVYFYSNDEQTEIETPNLEKKINVYCTPSKQVQIYFNNFQESKTKIYVYSILGQILVSSTLSSSPQTIDYMFKTGTYIMKIETNKQSFFLKFILK